jgi:hypothetical protein
MYQSLPHVKSFLAVIEFVQVQSQLKVDLIKVDAVLWTI